MSARVVLLAHGSRDPRWRAPFERLRDDLHQALGPEGVSLAYLELSPPTLLDVATAAAADGVRRLRVLPLFMALGQHTARDLPRLADEARARCPGLEVELLPPIGEHPAFARALRQVVALVAGEDPGA